MFDEPTHFKNETIRLLSKPLHVKHHFTLPQNPWSNGAVELLGRELLRVLRAVTLSCNFALTNGQTCFPLCSAINMTISPQRQNIAPVTAFTVTATTLTISAFTRTSTAKLVTIKDVQRERSLTIDSLKTFVADLHPVVQRSVSCNCQIDRDAKSRGVIPNFTEGDYVLVARDDFKENEKLSIRWRGPAVLSRRSTTTSTNWKTSAMENFRTFMRLDSSSIMTIRWAPKPFCLM